MVLYRDNKPAYRRSIEHEWRNHDRIILLYRTTSESYVRSLERDFVNLYRTDPKYNEKMANATGSGAYGEGMHYLYILL